MEPFYRPVAPVSLDDYPSIFSHEYTTLPSRAKTTFNPILYNAVYGNPDATSLEARKTDNAVVLQREAGRHRIEDPRTFATLYKENYSASQLQTALTLSASDVRAICGPMRAVWYIDSPYSSVGPLKIGLHWPLNPAHALGKWLIAIMAVHNDYAPVTVQAGSVFGGAAVEIYYTLPRSAQKIVFAEAMSAIRTARSMACMLMCNQQEFVLRGIQQGQSATVQKIAGSIKVDEVNATGSVAVDPKKYVGAAVRRKRAINMNI